MSHPYEKEVALLLPFYLESYRNELSEPYPSIKTKSWPSLSQANWLGETVARASNVSEIENHLKEQIKLWRKRDYNVSFYEELRRTIGDPILAEVNYAIQSAYDTIGDLSTAETTSLPAFTSLTNKTHLALARLHIQSLISHYRIAIQEQEEAV